MRLRLRQIICIAWVGFAIAVSLPAQIARLATGSTAASEPHPAGDTLNRTTPRDTVYEFLQACQAGNYLRASDYLDLRRLPAKNRRREGMELSLQLAEILNRDVGFDVDKLSDSPEGDRTDARDPTVELVDAVQIDGKKVYIELQRVQQPPAGQIWLFSADTVAAIPSLQALVGESDFEKHLPAPLVNTRFMDTSLWRWIALILLAPALGLLGRLLSRGVLLVVRGFFKNQTGFLHQFGLRGLVGPVALLLGVAAYGAGFNYVGPSALVRFYVTRILTFLAFMAIAWLLIRLLDLLFERIRFVADPHHQALYSSVLPLALRIVKIAIFVVAFVATISTWGYNTSTIWATLGVGSLAIALAAQKTLENLFGGISVIGDRPVLVGDFCKVGDMVGTVEHIGLRSTRIRTLNRTIVTVPNSQFSTMTLENFAKRDKMWFHPTFSLRCDATPDQIRSVMSSFEQVLRDHPKVDPTAVPVRFSGVADYSLTIEVFAYVLTPSFDEFLEIQSELLLKMLDVVERSGTGLAVPVRELVGSSRGIREDASAPSSTDGRSG